ncbi:MAG: hypothetical protein Q9P01_20710 [Anaerolineae bacterium]|nr:hypothetical protein [Anaerolineae bacterium]
MATQTILRPYPKMVSRLKKERKWQFRLWKTGTWFITFHFVVLGWVLRFALSDVNLSIKVSAYCFGY